MAPTWVIVCVAIGAALQVPAIILMHRHHNKRCQKGQELVDIGERETEEGVFLRGHRRMWLNRARVVDRHWYGSAGLWLHLVGLAIVAGAVLTWWWREGLFEYIF